MKRTATQLALLGIACAMVSAADHYIVTDLGTLGDATGASGVNDQGVAVGYAVDLLYRYHGFTSDQGVFSPLTSNMGMTAQAQAMGINSLDFTIAASYMLGQFDTTALLYDNTMPMMMPMNMGAFMPTAINDSMQIVGSRFVTDPTGFKYEQACIWQMGVLASLNQLSNGHTSLALGLNDAGWVVGSAFPAGSLTPTAVLWIGDTQSDLGTLGGALAQARAINNARQVVGISKTNSSDVHAFVYQLDALGGVLSRTDLPDLGSGYGVANAINEQGLIVGSSDNQAVLWENGAAINLNTRIDVGSGWDLANATGINESGQIVGVGALGGDPFRAFLLTPGVACIADLNGDGVLSFFDVSLFIQLYSDQDPIADFTGDGAWNFFDVSEFIGAYSAGCP